MNVHDIAKNIAIREAEAIYYNYRDVSWNLCDDCANIYDGACIGIKELTKAFELPVDLFVGLLDNIMLKLPQPSIDLDGGVSAAIAEAHSRGWDACLKEIQEEIEHELNRRR